MNALNRLMWNWSWSSYRKSKATSHVYHLNYILFLSVFCLVSNVIRYYILFILVTLANHQRLHFNVISISFFSMSIYHINEQLNNTTVDTTLKHFAPSNKSGEDSSFDCFDKIEWKWQKCLCEISRDPLLNFTFSTEPHSNAAAI